MQRIALGTCVSVLALVGCAPPQRVSLGPPPEPLLATRTRPPVPKPTPPAPPRVEPQPTPRGSGRYPADWYPSGGIQKGRWNVVVVHHSGTRESSPQSMHNYHLNERKWSGGLGYHFVIGNGVAYPDGEVFVGTRWTSQGTGAHCKAGSGRYFGAWRPGNFFNTNGIGICLIGNFDRAGPTPRQRAALARLLEFLCREAGVNPSRIYGHGEVTHKTACPGRYLNIADVRRSLSEIYAVSH